MMVEYTSSTTWRILIEDKFKENGDSWDAIVEHGCTLTDAQLDKEFDDGFGFPEGSPFTIWTQDFVYFPVQYDGAESVGSVPIKPNGKATEHVGG